MGMTPEELDLAVWPIFYQMSRRGITVSIERLEKMRDDFNREKGMLMGKIELMAGAPLNPMSGDQVAAWITANGMRPVVGKVKMTAGGRVSTDEKSLAAYQHPLLNAVVECRGLNKMVTAFIEPTIEKANDDVTEDGLYGFIHPRWRLTKVRSGRVAMEDPNLLAFPVRDEAGKKVRSCFVARPGYVLVSADFSQLEPRLAAALSGDPELLRIFSEGRDLYTEVAKKIGGISRTTAKILTLGILYGMSAQRLWNELIAAGCVTGDPPVPIYTLEACEKMIRTWFVAYPKVARYICEVVDYARDRNGVVYTMGRRARNLPALMLTGPGWPTEMLREEADRQAFNHVIQGTGMEQLKMAMLRVAKCKDVYPLLAIHDEMIYEVPTGLAASSAAAIALSMATDVHLHPDPDISVKLPVTCTIASSWGELKA